MVQPIGGKTWRFAYRFEGKQKLLSSGPFPETTLLAARFWREMMKHQLALGMHPSQECKNAKAKAADKPIENDNTFEQVAREWLETGTLAWTPRYAALVSGRFEAGIFPPIGKLDISTTADHGRDTRAILVELGRLKMVGGQEDMIVDVALDMLASS